MEQVNPLDESSSLPTYDPLGNVVMGGDTTTPNAPIKPVERDANITNDPYTDVRNKLNEPKNWVERWGLGDQTDSMVAVDRAEKGLPPSSFEENRKFIGLGTLNKLPTPEDVRKLRENQTDPNAIMAYDYVYGEGASNRILRVPPMKDIERLLANKDDPDARAYFDRLYGDVSMWWIAMMAKDDKGVALATSEQRKQAARAINRIYNGDYVLADSLETSTFGEFTRAFQRGGERLFQEAGQSLGVLDRDIVKPEVMPQNYPTAANLTETTTQFVLGQGIMNLVAPGSGLRGVAQAVRQIGIGGIVDAFGFDPNDPYAVKSIGEAVGLPQEIVDRLPDPEWFESDAGKRAFRAVEGGALGLATDGIIKIIAGSVKLAKKFRAGDTAGAEAAKEELAAAIEAADQVAPQMPKAAELQVAPEGNPAAREPATPTAQPRMPNVADSPVFALPKELAGAKPRWRSSTITFESDLDKALFITSQTKKSARDADYRLWLKDTGLTDQMINDFGRAVREALKKEAASGAENIKLKPVTVHPNESRAVNGPSLIDVELPPAEDIPLDPRLQPDPKVELPEPVTTLPKELQPDIRPDLPEQVTELPRELQGETAESAVARIQKVYDDVVEGPSDPSIIARTERPMVDDVPPTSSRLNDIEDAITGRTPEERGILNTVNPPQSEVGTKLRAILDKVPDFSKYTFEGLRKDIAPIMDEFLDLAKNDPDEFMVGLQYKLIEPDRNKLYAIVRSAAARVEQEIKTLGTNLEIQIKSDAPNAREIDDLMRQTAESQNLLKNIQTLEYPLDAEAGRLLRLAAIEKALAKKFRPDIAKLQVEGASVRDISLIFANAFDNVAQKEVNALFLERAKAVAEGAVEKVKTIDAKIDKQMEVVQQAAEATTQRTFERVVGALVELRATSLISSTGTLTRNIIGGAIHKALDRNSEKLGLLMEYGIKDGMDIIEAQGLGKQLAMKAGFDGQFEAIRKLFALAAKDAWNETSAMDLTALSDTKIKKVSSANFGLDANSLLGKSADLFGKGWRKQTIPLAISDEFLGALMARAEMGQEAAFQFMRRINQEKEIVLAKLKDKTLDAAERQSLRSQLATLKDFKKATIDGKTLEDFVNEHVKAGIDEAGHVIDTKAQDRVNYILLRNQPTGVGNQLESYANAGGGVLRLVQPFIRTTMNGFKRGLEYAIPHSDKIPILRNLVDTADELKSTDPRVIARARGKLMLAYAISGTSIMMALEGYSTGSGPRDRNSRITMDASSAAAPNSLWFLGKPYEISGMEPISIPITLYANIVQTYQQRQAEVDFLYESGRRAEALAKKKELEAWSEKAMSVAQAVVVGISGTIIDTNLMEGPKQIIDAFATAYNSADNTDKGFKQFQRWYQNYATSFMPGFARQFGNVVDPRRVDPASTWEAITATIGFKNTQPLVRDVVGRPIESKTPWRSVVGPLVPQTLPEKERKSQYVADKLAIYSKIIGNGFALPISPPEAKFNRVDMTKWKSINNARSVYDVYGDNYKSITIAGDDGEAKTVAEALYDVLTKGEQMGLSVGNKYANGKMIDVITAVTKKYRDAAWYKTIEIDERNNPIFQNELRLQGGIKADAKDQRYDMPAPFIRGISD